MKYLSSLLLFVVSIFSLAYAADTDFLTLLENKGIDTNALIEQQKVPRSTVAQLLNIVDCQDCYRPTLNMKNTLTQGWWESFRILPGKNFDDVNYSDSLQPNNNYYCISYVANRGYMNGYPRSTSPVCSGRFCGNIDITYADIIQTVFNISAKTFYTQYATSWKEITDRLSKQPTYVKSYFSIEDYAAINIAAIACKQDTCAMNNQQELQTYTKYCTFEPATCGMQEFAFAKKTQWPIAEMNILLQQGIFTPDDVQNLNIEDYAPGKYIVDLMERVKQRSQCIDDNDQDKDGIVDSKDSCYLIYNPKQGDIDKDGIGNVCDDDIDNDTIKNPIGIIDDNGYIDYNVIKEYITNNPKKPIDNCLTTPNQNQQDMDKNGVGDTCDILEHVGLRIQPKPITNERFVFTSQYEGSLKNFTWYYGDKTTGSGEMTSHTYRDPGVYTVRLDATTPKGNIVSATTTVTVGPGVPRAALYPSKLIQTVGEKVSYSIQLQGLKVTDVAYVDLQRGDGRTRHLKGNDITNFTDTYLQNGGYPINGIVYLHNDGKMAVSAYVTVLGQAFCLGNNGGSRSGHCDMDKDVTPDVCDNDIDGDGVTNPMGIILYEKKDCSYDINNTNTKISLGVLGGGLGAGEQGGIIGSSPINLLVLPWDNCPFTKNPDQKNCAGADKDSDSDGIIDSIDKCPLVGEFFNGTSDDDGCPEYNVTVEFPDTKLQPGTCNACPCQYAQNDSSIAPGDRVKAVLFDKQTNKPVTESQWYVVP